MAALAALVSALLLPGFTPLLPDAGGGQVLTGIFPGSSRPGYLYLPPGFSAARRYPVVYLLHGMPGSPSEYLDGTQLPEWADAQISGGAIRPFIGVLPAAGSKHGYNGEWAGAWEVDLVNQIVPWVDEQLPTIRAASARVLAGLSAGGFGAADIGLRHLRMFGTLESWSGYFTPLHDGPFKHADTATLAANDPVLLARTHATELRRLRTRFFVSSGPAHSHWFRPAQTVRFARELRELGLVPDLQLVSPARGEWRAQLDAGLTWALAPAG
ncbi:MAG TPA: alpha/beta hydrolase-fold protein [Gaiellaceae bacterium]